mgnify:CR=1 FL=1
MSYLSELGFEDSIIKLLKDTLPVSTIEILEKEKKIVTANISYLIDLGINNYQDAFVKFYNMFLLDEKSFDEIFSKYDKEDLIIKLEKNIAIMEYL